MPTIAPWKVTEQARQFLRGWPALLPAMLFSAVLLEWLLPVLAGEGRILLWPFALAVANAWLLGQLAHRQGLTAQAPAAYGWARVGDFISCAFFFSLLTAIWMFALVAVLRFGFGFSISGIERDLAGDHAFQLGLVPLAYLLLRLNAVCLGPLLDDVSGPWPRGVAALIRSWSLSRGWQAHWRGLAPMALGLSAVLALQSAREAYRASFGSELALLWHLLVWPAFGWVCLERWHALALARLAPAPSAAAPAAAAAAATATAPPTAADSRTAEMASGQSSFYYAPEWSPQVCFLSAAVNGDVATLQRLHAEGVDVDSWDNDGVTALLRAANARKPQAVRWLLDAGANPTARDLSGRSLLHLLVAYPETLPLLDRAIALGLSVDDQYDAGDTPLMTALAAGHLAGVRALLDRGADPSRLDRHGNTAVIRMIEGIYAFRAGKDQAAALALLDELLRRGIDPRARGQYRRDAIGIAASKGLVDVCAVLHRHGADLDSADAAAVTPLQQAIWLGHRPLVDWLLAHGAKLDFHSAVGLGDAERVQAMLAAEPALRDREHRGLRAAPIAIALRCGQEAMLRLLLAHGASPNGADPVCGALAHAVRQLPQVEVLQLLIEHGALLEAADGDGNTALQFAARDDRLDLARCLLDAGADPNAATERGYRVLGFARSDAMRELLRQYGGR